MLYLSEVKYDGANLVELAIKKGMNVTDVICSIANATAAIKKAMDLDCVDYKTLGLDKCDIEKKSYDARICAVLNKIISTQSSLAKTINTLNKVGSSTTNITNTIASDNLVKISKDDTVPGYLLSKLTSTQPGSLNVVKSTLNGDSLSMTGFVPIGAVVIIDGSRVDAFDNTGLGKPNTDCSCFAICNGQNGTRNRLGRFPRWADVLTKVGSLGGKADFRVALKNMDGFELDIDLETSEFNGSLTNNFGYENISMEPSWVGTHRDIVTRNGDPGHNNFTHKHTVKGKVTHAPNPNAIEAIQLLPLYIDELPIQRIL